MGAARKPVLPVVVVCAVLVGWLVWACVPALAAAPEAPEVSVELPVPATTATVHGVLDPGVEGAPGSFELGTYEFLYKQGKAGCEGEGKAPLSPGISLGGGKESVGEVLQGLSPGTEYVVCLLARSGVKGETSVSVPVAFTTAVPPQAPVTSEPASAITATSATLGGVLNPAGKGEAGSYEFFYRQSESECEGEGSSGGNMLGVEKEVVSAEVSGLAPNKPYTFCLLARNNAGETALGAPATFTTLSRKPSVSGESFSKVGSTRATISAQVDPGGLETTFTVQYGVTNSYGSETSVKLSASASVASAPLSGLEPNTEYHFRVLVANEDGSETGAGTEVSFTTLPTGTGGDLPDKREYEMVTPPENEDAEIYVPVTYYELEGGEAEGLITRRAVEVAANGDGVVYEGDPTHNGGRQSSGNGKGSPYLATRLVAGGWRQTSIQPPGRFGEYKGFSNDLSVGVLDTPSEGLGVYAEGQLPGPKGPTGEYQDIYRHTFGEESYQPLITKTPTNRPEGVGEASPPMFGGSIYTQRVGGKWPGLTYAGGSSDMGQLLFGANDALIEGGGSLEREVNEDVKQEIAKGENFEYLYSSTEGRLNLVDVLPDGKVEPNATFGGPPGSGREVRYNPPDFSHTISSDGSRVFWSALEVSGKGGGHSGELTFNPKALYMRENATQSQSPLNAQNECTVSSDACTVQVDREVGGGGRFWTASSDGSKVFFTKLDLYEYDVTTGTTIDLTPGVNVQGVIGASEDGDYVYYVDSSYNLYMLHKSDSGWEVPVLVSTLSQRDGEYDDHLYLYGPGEGEIGDWTPDMGQRTAEVTPDGSSMVFMSNQSLKTVGFPNGYPNRGAYEVYVYSAAQKTLSCASCSPSGESASGSAFLPISWSYTSIPSWISEDGDQVFFDSGAALVSQDTDGTQDVYEWEREGSGSCTKGAARTGGCIYLLSGGTSNVGSWLLGASMSGRDVFMVSRAHLTSEDQGETFDVFDARVEGVPPVSPPACVGTGCQGAPAPPPTFATPSSSTFEGVGNFPAPPGGKSLAKVKKGSLGRAQKLARALKACRGKPRKRRALCEVQARRRYGTVKKAKKASKSAKGSE